MTDNNKAPRPLRKYQTLELIFSDKGSFERSNSFTGGSEFSNFEVKKPSNKKFKALKLTSVNNLK